MVSKALLVCDVLKVLRPKRVDNTREMDDGQSGANRDQYIFVYMLNERPS